MDGVRTPHRDAGETASTVARELEDACRSRLGDALQCVGYYTADERSFVYVHPAVDAECSQLDLDVLAWRLRKAHDCLADTTEYDTPLGAPEVTVHAFDGRQILQVPLRDCAGAFAVLEETGGEVLKEILTEIGA